MAEDNPAAGSGSGGSEQVDQNAIDDLMNQVMAEAAAAGAGGSSSTPAPAQAAAAAAPEATTAPSAVDLADEAAIEDLLKQASFDDPMSMGGSAGAGGAMGLDPAADASEFRMPDFQQVMRDAQASSIDLLRDVDLNVKIELGRSRMLVEDVLKLGEGSVVELDKLAGDPVDVFVNERLVARGEVLVLNDNFCVRINEIVAGVREEGL